MNIDPKIYAYKLGIDLYTEYKPAEAAKLIGVGLNVLRKAKNDGDLDVIMVGERNYTVLGADLVQWKLTKRTKSANTTSRKTDPEHGVVLGMTRPQNSESQLASAQRILA